MVSWLLREKGLGCVEELDKQTKKVNKEIRCNTSRNTTACKHLLIID